MTDFSIRATAKNVNKKRIKGAKVAVVGDFHLINFPCDKTVLQCYYVPAIPLEYVKDPSAVSKLEKQGVIPACRNVQHNQLSFAFFPFMI